MFKQKLFKNNKTGEFSPDSGHLLNSLPAQRGTLASVFVSRDCIPQLQIILVARKIGNSRQDERRVLYIYS